MYVELAPGLGETLASGARGTPWRLRVCKGSLVVEILSFANFSGVGELDYSELAYTKDPQSLVDLGIKLCKLGVSLEEAFGEPQDIEGAIVGEKVFIVQSRPQ